jgi:hypothetical protein
MFLTFFLSCPIFILVFVNPYKPIEIIGRGRLYISWVTKSIEIISLYKISVEIPDIFLNVYDQILIS